MRTIFILIGLCFVLAAGYYVAANQKEDASASSEIPLTNTQQAILDRKDDGQPVERTGTMTNKPDRIVGERVIAVPEFPFELLERLPDREPLSKPIGRDNEETASTRLFHRPIATAAGIVDAQGHRIHIAGIEPILPDKVCENEQGRSGPCGKRALTAFRAWLRGRAIECDVAGSSADGVIDAQCRLGGKDVASWLVKNGWARARPGTIYDALEVRARKQKLGIFASVQ